MQIFCILLGLLILPGTSIDGMRNDVKQEPLGSCIKVMVI